MVAKLRPSGACSGAMGSMGRDRRKQLGVFGPLGLGVAVALGASTDFGPFRAIFVSVIVAAVSRFGV